MARSHSIYIVQSEEEKLIGGFTVKHELVSFLKKLTVKVKKIYKLRDNHPPCDAEDITENFKDIIK
ncbi:hypothetical protein M0P65_05220 [Candidatus Gracilibacteria bacterium]|nr:hypothetical protein [Candidatus Gracilibacteria bacterium]